MLTPYDDYLVHQAPTTFDHAVTSDHRFFDRWAVGAYHEELSVMYGLANYKNMNVCDGYLCVARGDRQYNLRLSRPLRPDFSMGIDPLELTVDEPLWTHRVVVAEDPRTPLSCDLTWSGTRPIREEAPHYQRVLGRTALDFRRLYQLGRLSGWIGIDDERVEIQDGWAWRDHSWGVRPSMGGIDPVGGARSEAKSANLFLWFAFQVGAVTGQLQLKQNADGEVVDVSGHVLPDPNDPDSSRNVVAVRHRIDFVDGLRAFSRVELEVVTADGKSWTFDAAPSRPAWVFSGSGYSGGWEDGQGLGVSRGERLESDAYKYLGLADVRMPDGSIEQPWHREAEVVVTLDGASGNGHLTVIANAPAPKPTLESSRA